MEINGKFVILVAIVVVMASAGVAAIAINGSGDDALSIAYSNKVDYEPLIIAKELDLYAEEDVRVTPYTVTGGIQAAEALATGAVDLAAMGDSPALLLLSQNSEMRIVGRYGGGEGMHRIVGWTDITSPLDLTGKSVGIQFGSSTHGAFLSWADLNGLDLSEVTLVPLSPTDMPQAMATRQIDAMAGSEPWPTNVENTCGDQVHEIGNSSRLGNSFPLVLVTTKSVIDTRSSELQSAMNAISKAVDIINQDRGYAASICCNLTGLCAKDQLRCMEPLFYEMGFNQTDKDSMELTASFLAEYGKIQGVPPLDDLVDKRFLGVGMRSNQVEIATCVIE
jgi:ABC-type nitrate/sulfonate/bicarbonate transport system substrate-binding protein